MQYNSSWYKRSYRCSAQYHTTQCSAWQKKRSFASAALVAQLWQVLKKNAICVRNTGFYWWFSFLFLHHSAISIYSPETLLHNPQSSCTAQTADHTHPALRLPCWTQYGKISWACAPGVYIQCNHRNAHDSNIDTHTLLSRSRNGSRWRLLIYAKHAQRVPPLVQQPRHNHHCNQEHKIHTRLSSHRMYSIHATLRTSARSIQFYIQIQDSTTMSVADCSWQRLCLWLFVV